MTFIPSTFKCNGCGRERTASNGWYELQVQQDDVDLDPFIYICAFKSSEAAEHYCGKECLIRAVSIHLYMLHTPIPAGSPSRSEFPLASTQQSEAPMEPVEPSAQERVCTCYLVSQPGRSRPDPFCEVHGHDVY